jgi:hypothetical protein
MKAPLIKFEFKTSTDIYWADATSILLELSDIPMTLNNYDTSLKEDTIDGKLSSLCLTEFPTLGKDCLIKISQGTKTLHYGDITSFNPLEDADTFEVSFVSTPSYMRLKTTPNIKNDTKVFVLESYWLPLFNANPTLVPCSLITRQVYSYTEGFDMYVYTDGYKLMQYVFKHLTGYDLVIDNHVSTHQESMYVVREVLWNYGCEFFGNNESLRATETLGTWFDWFELILRLGAMFYLDPDTGNYRVTFIAESTTAPSIAEPTIDIISIDRSDENLYHDYNNQWKYAWDYRWYCDFYTESREVNTTKDLGNITYPNGGAEFLQNKAINHAWVRKIATYWEPSSIIIGSMNGRFDDVTRRYSKYTLVDFNNFRLNNNWFFNICSVNYKYGDGFFSSEVEFRSNI